MSEESKIKILDKSGKIVRTVSPDSPNYLQEPLFASSLWDHIGVPISWFSWFVLFLIIAIVCEGVWKTGSVASSLAQFKQLVPCFP